MNFHRRIENIFLAPDKRDKQRKLGPSNLSNPCARHLAFDFLGSNNTDTPFVMGAKIGTAIHDWLEKRVQLLEPTWVTERKLPLGVLGTYGEVRGSCDLYIPEIKRLVDYKTTTKAKLPKLLESFGADPEDMEFKVRAYIAQTHLYALSAEKAGDEVDKITILFIPRDSVTFDDVRHRTIDYDREYAQHVFNRALKIWEWLEEGGDPEDLPETEGCFDCEYGH